MVHDNVDPAQGVLSIGTTFPDATGAWRFTPTGTGQVNREPSEVTADGEVYCYPLTGGVMLFRLTEPATLKAELKSGVDCTSHGGLTAPEIFRR